MSDHEEEVEGACERFEEEEEEEEEDYAAEGLACEAETWVTFDGRRTPRAEFDGWLASNWPSRASEPARWLAVLGPACPPPPAEAGDPRGLRDDWERLRQSGRPVTPETVRELALNRRVRGGRWLMQLDTGFKADSAWGRLARAALEGKLPAARVSPRRPGARRHVLCVPAADFCDPAEALQLDAAIRAAGIKCPLSYQPDAYAHLGLAPGNRWHLQPTLYESRFDLECIPHRSRVVNTATMTELT